MLNYIMGCIEIVSFEKIHSYIHSFTEKNIIEDLLYIKHCSRFWGDSSEQTRPKVPDLMEGI